MSGAPYTECVLDGHRFAVRFDRPVDCSRPVRFDGSDPALFGAGPPGRAPLRAGAFVGSVAAGAAVNVDRLDLVPHCHGTHTESAGHLATGPLPLSDVWRPGPVTALLATVHASTDAGAQNGPAWRPGDLVVTAAALSRVLEPARSPHPTALVLRITGPPEGSGIPQQGAPEGPECYLEEEAASVLARSGVLHLVLELPSLDRTDDGGRLAAHRAFWDMDPEGGPSAERRAATLTELARVPEGTPDGLYLLDLHLPNLATDAVPSRPVLYPLEPLPDR